MNVIKKQNVFTYTVEEDTELLPFLLETITDRSRNSVKSILTRGQVKINGQIITQHNHPLEAGQEIDILSNLANKKKSILMDVKVLHEDENIIVINKAEGVLSTDSEKPNEATAFEQLTVMTKQENPNNKIYIVHRLDRDTSGVMLYAKNEETRDKMQNNWNDIVKERKYNALVEGTLDKKEGQITSWMKKGKDTRMISNQYDNGGKRAITNYRVVREDKNYSLLELELETGRTNQIRVHMQDIGHSVIGDRKYGSKVNPIKRMGLHATTLSFIHPTTDQLVTYTVKPPKSFTQILK